VKIERFAELTGRILGFGISGLLISGGSVVLIYCIFERETFLFGYHYVGLNLRSFLMVASVVAIAIGIGVLRSTLKVIRNIR